MRGIGQNAESRSETCDILIRWRDIEYYMSKRVPRYGHGEMYRNSGVRIAVPYLPFALPKTLHQNDRSHPAFAVTIPKLHFSAVGFLINLQSKSANGPRLASRYAVEGRALGIS